MITKQTTRESLTDRQMEIYNHIRNEIAAGNPAPSYRELQAAFEIRSPNGVRCHLRALERKGWIKNSPYNARSISLVSEPRTEIVTLVPGRALRIGGVLVRCISVSLSGKVNLEVEFADTQELSCE
jgi:SOS-response transcriptional repressor LexA